MNVVLLSNSRDRIEAIRAALKRRGVGCTVVPDEEHASTAIQMGREGVFVIDSETTGDLGRVLQNRSQSWPILVLTRRFDSSAWVEMFKAGASEVIGDPLHPAKLDAAFDGFIGPLQIQSAWRGIARWLRIGK